MKQLILIVALALAAGGCKFEFSTGSNSNNASNANAPTPKPAATNSAPAEKPSASPAESSNIKTTVVKFPAGETGTDYETTIGPGETHVYVVNVKKGQYLGAQTYADDDVAFTVRKKGGADLEVPEGSVKWGGDVPESGDYEIVIKNVKKKTDYKISINAE
jgi:hypothetical protein